MTRCGQCHQLAARPLCTHCATALRIQLGDVRFLLGELEITYSRQDHLGGPGDGRGNAETPLPFRPRVAELLWVLHHTLSSWVQALGVNPAKLTTADLATQLTAELDTIALRTDAGQLAREVTYAIRCARAAIDRHDDRRIILGSCEAGLADGTRCQNTIYSLPSREYVTCEGCGAVLHVAQRAAQLRELAAEYHGTSSEISGFLLLYGVRCTPSMIRHYARAGWLLAVPGTQPAKYRIGDVSAALANRYQRGAKRGSLNTARSGG